MKICWDNLDKLRYSNKTGKWYLGQNTYVYKESCKVCGNPYLTRPNAKIGDFCDNSCAMLYSNPNYKHGKSQNNRTYISWICMKKRCLNKNFPKYPEYGKRGIKICKRWMKFENFLADMGERPKGFTLDRIDNDGHYEPSNCKWSTPKEQANNRRERRT